ncbi:feruloyl esterase [Mannheimia granulomatis]|uniref:tannase/feruloyl esterase family alpha/beta hydrolase n=1 Tax=Mannheimia granulomatis TaxID=85402 RepID=UPI00159D367D|nr:tannase/feruloyl esterase family alpha/beta hydrolase [Mannheimia granulomatis]QLB15439.1 feruloyl esterase [Mannheimia granulomatis]
MMKRFFPFYLFSLLFLFSYIVKANSQQCGNLKSVPLYNTEIYKAEWVAQSDILPAYCLIHGEIEKRVGVGGKPYGIQFELRLPEKWNEKFLFQGAGGIGGVIFPAEGKLYPHGATGLSALSRGYAVVSNDSGHPNRELSFTEDWQARLNYAYASIGKVTDIAKQLITYFYQKSSRYNYFMGCSNGGREAMMAAIRYPQEFDGVIAGSPGFRVSHSVLAEVWDNRTLLAASPQNSEGEKILAEALSQQDLDLVAKGVLQHCDKLDGLEDGLINAWEQCDFQPEMVVDKIGKEKANLLKTLFDGAKNSQGELIYSRWPYDSSINSKGWRHWKLGDSKTAAPNSISFKMGLKSLTHYYLTPRQPEMDPLRVDLDIAAEQVKAVGQIHDTDSLDFSDFQQHGGKMLIYQGVSDPIFSAVELRDWYQALQQAVKNPQNFAKLFFVPAMNHCGRGATVNDFDMLTSLENWVEKGESPDHIEAKAGELYPNEAKRIPLCAYPKVAYYRGGDPHHLESFECR